MRGTRKNPFATAPAAPGGPSVPPGAPEPTPGQPGRPKLKALRGEAGKRVAGVMADRLRGMKRG